MGKKVEQGYDKCSDGSMDYNYSAVKKASQKTNKTESVQTDYSITGKKRSNKDFA